MNWRYLILPNYLYVDRYLEWERVFVDELNNVFLKKWKNIDSCSDMLFEVKEWEKRIIDWFQDLGDLIEEKWEFFLFKNKIWDKFYIYNSIDNIWIFSENKITFFEVLFEDRKQILEEKLWAYLNYVYSNNVWKIKNLANTATIKTREEFIQNIWNEWFISQLINIDRILLKEIYFLSKKNFYWWVWHTYLYFFKEEWWRLRPVSFKKDFLTPIYSEKIYDKVEVLMAFQWKSKINLFFEKLINHTLFLKKRFITKSDLQNLYNFHVKK